MILHNRPKGDDLHRNPVSLGHRNALRLGRVAPANAPWLAFINLQARMSALSARGLARCADIDHRHGAFSAGHLSGFLGLGKRQGAGHAA